MLIILLIKQRVYYDQNKKGTMDDSSLGVIWLIVIITNLYVVLDDSVIRGKADQGTCDHK
jgi:hypothetical protein